MIKAPDITRMNATGVIVAMSSSGLSIINWGTTLLDVPSYEPWVEG